MKFPEGRKSRHCPNASALCPSLRHLRLRALGTGILLIVGTAWLAGCGTAITKSIVPTSVMPIASGEPQITGTVHGGQQPVANSTVQLWQVGTVGYGTGATQLGSSAVTNQNGGFSLAGKFSCGNGANGGNTLLYLTATGGNPGLSSTGNGTPNNPALVMMTTLGTCGSITSATKLTVNEVTTVASAYALAQFTTASGGVGSYGSSPQGLANAFAAVSNLVDTVSGTALAITPNGNGIAPQGKINALANALAACVNSPGPTAPGCVALFRAATLPGGSVPVDTLGALLNIAQNPGNNAASIIPVAGSQVPFQPAVASANDWTLTIAYASGGVVPAGVALDSIGNVWVANYGTGGSSSSVSYLSSSGVPAANSPYANSSYTNGTVGLAVDPANNVWIANHDNNSAAELNAPPGNSTYTIAPLSDPYTDASFNGPVSVAIDGRSNIWFANSGNALLIQLSHTNYRATPTTLTNSSLTTPRSLAFDISGNAWVANGGGATIAKLNTTAQPVPVISYAAPGLTNGAGIALDGQSNLWITDTQLNAVAKLDRNGVAVSPSAGYSGGGFSGSNSDAIDGLGNLWVANTAGNRITALTPSGTSISPTGGYQDASLAKPLSLAIDASGNLWIANGTPSTVGPLQLTLSEMVGVAAPAVTPLAVAVAQAQIALRPGTPQPVAKSGGPYSTVAGTSLNFNAAASTDPGSETLSYLWSFGDGSLGSGVTPAHTYSSAGTYTVVLTVTNTDGHGAVATTSVAVSATPLQPPVVNTGGPYTSDTVTPVFFNGGGSYDPTDLSAGASLLTLSWTFGDGTTGTGPSPLHTYSVAGSYNVTLTATTSAGSSASATTTVTVSTGAPVAGAPIANAGGPYSGTTNSAIAFNGSGSSDPNGLPLTYSWAFGDGSTSSLQNPNYTYAVDGTYSPILTVSNATAQTSASATVVVTAPAAAKMVVSTGGPYTVAALQPVTMDGSGTTDPSGRQLLFTWDFGDGATSLGPNPRHVYAKAGSYTVNLSVTDGASQTGTATTEAVVTAPPPEAITASAGGPYANISAQNIVFDASGSSDNLGNALTYSWSFGDGSTGTGVQPTHAYTNFGNFTATVTVASGTAAATATATVVVNRPISVAITTPAAHTLFGNPSVTVSGTVDEPNTSVTVNGVTAQVNGTSFTATGVVLREGVNIISATATDSSGGIGSGVVSVIVDLTAPRVSITSPASGSTLTNSQITVAGLVNDIVTGTIGTNDVTVTVNGQPAQVSNRSYQLSGFQLVPGYNSITVVATDNVGNTGSTTETVQLLPANSQLSIVKVSGDSQTGVVQTVLPQPLMVQLLSSNGTPVAGRPITFTVSRSDGTVEVMPNAAQALTVTSDANGRANVLFKLGSRSGLGINQVQASTPGAAAAAVFTATTTTGPPTQIHAETGENQRGLLGQQLAEGFQAVVQDAFQNPVPGITVNFTAVGATDGSLSTSAPVTDSNGKVVVNLTLGQQEGLNNYAYTADYAGDTTGIPVTFIASAFAPGPVPNTSVSGTVYDNGGHPVPNATVTIANTRLSTVTNTSGNFTINGAPVGTVTLTIDGSTATTTQTLPFLTFVLQDLPGQNNTLGKTIYLPAIDIDNAQTVGGSDPVTLTMTGVPGLAFTVAPNSVTFPDGSTVGKLSISQVKSDLVPMEPLNGTVPNLIWTIQPAGTRFSVPVQVTVPNTSGLPPGYVSEIYQYDHDLEQFVSVGTGHVSADGSVIVGDPGFGITKAGWGFGFPVNNPAFGCVQSCNSTNPCITAKLSPSGCLCYKTVQLGKACGSSFKQTPLGGNSCLLPGTCDASGNCTGGFVARHTDCSAIKPNFCDSGAECNGYGQCISTGTIADRTDNQVNGSLSGDENTFSLVSKKVFTDPWNSLMKYLGHPEATLQYEPYFQNSDVYTCCAATENTNALVERHKVGAKLTINGPLLPVILTTVPPVVLEKSILGYKMGVYLQPSGSVDGNITVKNDSCTKKVCTTFGLTPEAKLSFIGQIAYGESNIQVALTGGLNATVSSGCGTFDANISTLPVATEGNIEFGFGLKFNRVIVLLPSQTIYSIIGGLLPQ